MSQGVPASYPTEEDHAKSGLGDVSGRRARGRAIGPAQATVVEKGRFSEFDFEPYRFAYDCGPRGGHRSGERRLPPARGQEPQRLGVLLARQDRVREVHTNPENGKWFSVRGSLALQRGEGEARGGLVFELQDIEAGQPFVLEDSLGNLVLRDLGVVRQTILFDTGGRPRGTFIDVLDISLGGPHPRFTGDLCEIATPLIGS